MYTSVRNCNNGPGCGHVTIDLCNRIESFKKRCPLSCRECNCEDLIDCEGVTPVMCDSIPETLHKSCALTCGICGKSGGKKRKNWKQDCSTILLYRLH